jgi:Fe-S cluster biogenesis protein NfuA
VAVHDVVGDGPEERLQRLEALIGEVEALGDERARRVAVEAIQALLELHGDALERILALLGEAEARAGASLVSGLAEDQVVGGLLLLHGLHPASQEQRVREALANLRPFLDANGAAVELLSVAGGVVRLRLDGTRGERPSAALTLRYAIEQAVLEAAPDVTAIDIDGRVAPEPDDIVPRRDPGQRRPAGGDDRNRAACPPEI